MHRASARVGSRRIICDRIGKPKYRFLLLLLLRVNLLKRLPRRSSRPNTCSATPPWVAGEARVTEIYVGRWLAGSWSVMRPVGQAHRGWVFSAAHGCRSARRLRGHVKGDSRPKPGQPLPAEPPPPMQRWLCRQPQVGPSDNREDRKMNPVVELKGIDRTSEAGSSCRRGEADPAGSRTVHQVEEATAVTRALRRVSLGMWFLALSCFVLVAYVWWELLHV